MTDQPQSIVETIARALHRHALVRPRPNGRGTMWCVCLTWSADQTSNRARDEKQYERHVAEDVARALEAERPAAAESKGPPEQAEPPRPPGYGYPQIHITHPPPPVIIFVPDPRGPRLS